MLRSRGGEIPTEWLERAEVEGVASARRVTFNSMAFANGDMALVDVKAVTDGYPLRGHLKLPMHHLPKAWLPMGYLGAAKLGCKVHCFSNLELALGDETRSRRLDLCGDASS